MIISHLIIEYSNKSTALLGLYGRFLNRAKTRVLEMTHFFNEILIFYENCAIYRQNHE